MYVYIRIRFYILSDDLGYERFVWDAIQSALTGGIVGVVAMSWVSINAQWAIASGGLHFEHKPTAVDQCTYDFEAPLLQSNHTTMGQNSIEKYIYTRTLNIINHKHI